VNYNKIQSTDVTESIKTVSRGGKDIQQVTSEINVFTTDKVLEGSSEAVKDAYQSLKEEIFQIDSNIEERPAKTMISYYSDGRGLLWINPQKNRLTIHLRKGEYTDKYGKIKPEGWGGYPLINVNEDEVDIPYLRDLIKQAYEN